MWCWKVKHEGIGIDLFGICVAMLKMRGGCEEMVGGRTSNLMRNDIAGVLEESGGERWC